jgi:hypothetical protein
MLVAAPAFVLLGSLALSTILDIYCADLWASKAAAATAALAADTSSGGAPSSTNTPSIKKSKAK